MNRKSYKNGLKESFNNRPIPNVLNKIDLQSIEIESKVVVKEKSYHRPIYKLAYSLSLLILVGAIVTILVLNMKTPNLYAKEDEAILSSVMQVYNLSNEPSAYKSNISLDNDNDNKDSYTLANEFLNDVKNEISSFIGDIEAQLFTKSVSKSDSLNRYDKVVKFETSTLSGLDINYQIFYNYQELDEKTIVSGILLIDGTESFEFEGEIINDDYHGRMIIIKKDNITIKTYLKDEMRIYDTEIQTQLGVNRSKMSQYIENGKTVIELKSDLYGFSEQTLRFSETSTNNERVIEVQLINDSVWFGIKTQGSLIVTATELENQIVYHYQFSGNIDILGARISFSENSYHEKSYRNKR